MNAIRRTAELNARELADVTPPTASWHRDYSDTAFVYIGGLDPRLSEGDVLQIFSQYGEPVWIKLARDRETGKSRGFGWLKYEDQRSCDLAVDNLGGCNVLGRMLNVDHTRYKSARGKDGQEEEEDMGDNTVPPEDRDRFGNIRVAGDVTEDEQSEAEELARPLLKEEKELMEIIRTHDEDDPMKAYLIEQKKEEIEKAKKALGPVKSKSKSKSKDDKHKKRRRHRSQSPDGDVKNGDGEKERRRHHHRDEKDREGRRRDRHDERAKHRDEDSDEDRSARREPRDRRSKERR